MAGAGLRAGVGGDGGARAVVAGEPLPWDEIAIATVGALVLAVLSLWWVRSRLEQFRQRGYVTRYS